MKAKKYSLLLSSALVSVTSTITLLSCSSATEEIIDKIEDKINIEELKSPSNTTVDITSFEAIERIEHAVNPQEKRDALKFFTNISLPYELDFIVLEATINNEIYTTINVDIRIFERKNDNNYKDVTLTVTEFRATIEFESRKFMIQAETTKPNITSEKLVENIEIATSSNGRFEILHDIVDLPTLDKRFDCDIRFATINNINNTIVDVVFRVFEKSNIYNYNDVVFQIIGLTTRLKIQMAKFNDPFRTTNSNAFAEQVETSVNEAPRFEKQKALRLFANI
ncbi:MAG: hypothetical protein ACRC9F_00725, partial [Metamycoplasmataceae bacterium]